jgi:hypothetical protein
MRSDSINFHFAARVSYLPGEKSNRVDSRVADRKRLTRKIKARMAPGFYGVSLAINLSDEYQHCHSDLSAAIGKTYIQLHVCLTSQASCVHVR